MLFGFILLVPFGMPALGPQTTAASATGRWSVTRSVSRIDDSPTVTLSLVSSDEINAWPAKTIRPRLVFRCKEHAVEAFVVVDTHPAIEDTPDEATLTLRFDKEPAYAFRGGSLSTDGEAIFLGDGKAFIMTALPHDALLVRFVPFNSNPQDMAFQLGGLPEALKPLQIACDWSPTRDADEVARLKAEEKRNTLEQINERIERLVNPSTPEAQRIIAVWDLGTPAGRTHADLAVPALTRALVNDPSESVRVNCAKSLERLGPAAHAALPTLEGLAPTTSGPLREAVEMAILKIRR